MVFSNLFFLYFFLPLNLICYFLAKSIHVRNGILIVFSLFFYAWGEPRYVPLLVGMVLINWIFGLMIEKYRGQKLAKAGPAAAAYEKVKDRTAGIELEAHCRAQAVQAEAEERIRKTRAEVEQWLNRVQGNYGRLRADMDAAVSRACGELDQVRQTLEQISGELARQDEGLDKLTKSCCAELTHRAPDPLPLDEK